MLSDMHYRVLRSHPLTAKTGETSYEDGHAIKWHRITSWPTLGYLDAKSDEEALRLARQKFGGRPVVERVEEIHYI